MKKKKSSDNVSTKILLIGAVAMVALFVGLILFGIIQSCLTPKITIGKAEITNVIKSEKSDVYEVTVSVKDNEKKSVKISLLTKIGFDIYKTRHSTSPKPSFYRFFQVLNESKDEVLLPPNIEQEIPIKVQVGHDASKNLGAKSDSKVYALATIEKAIWVKELREV